MGKSISLMTRFLFPGGALFVAGVWGIPRIPATVIPLETFVALFFFVSVAALLLAWRFHRDSAFFSILVIAGAWLVMGVAPGPHGGNTLHRIPELLTGLLTIDIVLFFLFRDRGLFSIYGLVRFLFVAIQVIGFILLFQSGNRGVIGEWVSHLPHTMTFVENVPFILVSIGLVILFINFLKARSPLSAGGFWSLIASFYMITATHSRFTATFWSLLTVGILVVAIVEQSFQLAYHDELTGLPGRRALNEFLAATSGPLTALMVDIDHFKRFNDRYGHDVGDQVLKLVASRLAEVRGGRAYRYGGEEFIIAFPGRSLENVLSRAEEAREAVKKAEFVLRRSWQRRKGGPKKRKNGKSSGKRLSVTVSIGIAETSRKNPSPAAVIKAADKALYRAKRAGRNRVSK
ncbi:MAG: GGDEF domain-containing protein [Acidobacteria bacterium]|nr:GGDEF domain-containing protein [Acidobacteriota bacterium]